MRIKILFLDDIFSEMFRKTHDSEQLAFDDAWVDSIEREFTNGKVKGVDFEIVKSGEIDQWKSLIDTEKPDLVLLDLYWYEQAKQKGSGYHAVDISMEALKGIRKNYPDLPVIQYTVKPDRETMDRSYEAGATFFLEKVPLAIPEVHSALKYLVFHLMRSK
ncbi:MAG: response regulator [Pseudomonadota bacterium]